MGKLGLIFIALLCTSCYEYEKQGTPAEGARRLDFRPDYQATRSPSGVPVPQELVQQPAPKKKLKQSKVLQTIAPTQVHARHPEHFYRSVPAIVSVTFGDPLVKELETIEHTDSIPKAVAYSVALQGDPPDQFIITPAEQVILAPVPGIPSSTAYFSVIPQSRGQKKLHYFVKAQMTAGSAGIGLPELHKTILVEVNRQSIWISTRSLFKENFGKLFSAIGAAFGAWLLLKIKKWLKLKETPDEAVK